MFGKPAGNAMGGAPEWAVWVDRHVMIAFTTMMWMAEVLGYDTAPMEGFDAGGFKVAYSPESHNGSKFVDLTIISRGEKFVR